MVQNKVKGPGDIRNKVYRDRRSPEQGLGTGDVRNKVHGDVALI